MFHTLGGDNILPLQWLSVCLQLQWNSSCSSLFVLLQVFLFYSFVVSILLFLFASLSCQVCFPQIFLHLTLSLFTSFCPVLYLSSINFPSSSQLRVLHTVSLHVCAHLFLLRFKSLNFNKSLLDLSCQFVLLGFHPGVPPFHSISVFSGLVLVLVCGFIRLLCHH